jgi:nucleoside-diphosphate-sugar epimerase
MKWQNMMNKKNILITGGGGLLGESIIKMIDKEKYNIVSFSRKYYQELDSYVSNQILGNIENKTDIYRALQNIDLVIHTAAKVGMIGIFDDFYKTNYLGTKNLIEVMKELKINKLIYTSTPSVVFEKDHLKGVDESRPYAINFLTNYAQTKKMAEEFVLKSNKVDFFVTALRPHLIFGPKDKNLIPQILISHRKKRLKIIGDGNNLVDVIFVDNAAKAHLNAVDILFSNPQKISGKAYFIGQGPIKLWDFINQVLIHFNERPVDKKININIAYFIGYLFELFYNTFKISSSVPPMTRFIALQLGKSHYFSHINSKNDLGEFEIYSIEEGILKL